jgi:hypothetical protein
MIKKKKQYWTWSSEDYPSVLKVFSEAENQSSREWYDQLETAADCLTGKVLCVCAGIALARTVIEKKFIDHKETQEANELLDELDKWIDYPTDERNDYIAKFLFEDQLDYTEDTPLETVWSALRIATSSLGNYEAGYQLGYVVDEAEEQKLDAVTIAKQAIQSRIKN